MKLLFKNRISKFIFIILTINFLYPSFLIFTRSINIKYFSNLDSKIRVILEDKIRFLLNSNKRYTSDLKFINVQEKISIRNRKDLVIKKEKLRNYLNLDNKTNKLIHFKNDNSFEFENKNIDFADKFVFEMENQINSISYLLTPVRRNDNLLIFHLGHDGYFKTYRKQINFFINKGYDVLLIAMPLTGKNRKPVIDIINIGKIKLNNHDKLKFLEVTDKYSPLSYFFSPTNAFLKKAMELKTYNQINMIGISGGGWTTIIFSAFNDLVDSSFSIAGGRPISLMFDNQFGDYEQTQPRFYSKFNNFDLYLMASFNDKDRRFFQVINKFEECCFKYWTLYEKEIKDIANAIGGSFNLFIDETHASHDISSETLKFIHDQINKKEK